ncbi:MAG: ComEC/Rec2 family competence protein [Clostridium sp.]
MKKLYSLLTIIIIAFNIIGCNSKNFNDEFTVHYINVGQGDCILIEVNNKTLLIDAGPKEERNNVISYLNKESIKKLDYIIATHPHEDHIGNMSEVIKNYDVGDFYAPKITNTTKSFERMVDALKDKNKKINVIKEGTDSIDLGKNTKVKVFSPSIDKYDNLNNYSPIIKIEYGDTSFLFTGDAEKEVEDYVLKFKDELNCDVIKLGHHGSSSSSSPNFIKQVSPSTAIISCGKDNKYGHPHKETLSTLQKYDINYFITVEEGSIIVKSDGKKIKF